jgi:hypothetical protein
LPYTCIQSTLNTFGILQLDQYRGVWSWSHGLNRIDIFMIENANDYSIAWLIIVVSLVNKNVYCKFIYAHSSNSAGFIVILMVNWWLPSHLLAYRDGTTVKTIPTYYLLYFIKLITLLKKKEDNFYWITLCPVRLN